MKLTPEMLTGKSREHLVNLPTAHSSNHFFANASCASISSFATKCGKKMALIYSLRAVFVILNANNLFGTVNLRAREKYTMIQERH